MKLRFSGILFVSVACLLIGSGFQMLHGQNLPSVALLQIRSILQDKQIDEEILKTRLKAKGLDVDKMTQQEILANQKVIQQTVEELEQERSRTGNEGIPLTETNLVREQDSSLRPRTGVSSNESPTGNKDKQQAFSEVTKPETIDSAANLIYGHHFFINQSLDAYKIFKDASPPDTYMLGPGDKINVLIFGRSQADLNFEINSAGFIQPNLMPKIFLSGLTLRQAKEMLYKKFSTYFVFEPGQFTSTLQTSRTVSVQVFGEVARPGTYTMSGLQTALGALVAAGGPTSIGTVRQIQLIRGGQKKTLDVYAFLKNPSAQFDFYLQHNDIIYVPFTEKLVALEGSVLRPMRYELLSNEGVIQLLDYAGGLKSDAYTDFLQIQRIENNKTRIQDYNLKEVLELKNNLTLFNGDIVRTRSINAPLKALVKASGSFLYPGVYALQSTLSLKGLIDRAKLTPEAKTDHAFLIRKRLDQTIETRQIPLKSILQGRVPDLVLQEEDEFQVFDQSRYVDQFTLEVSGEVRQPFTRQFAFNEGMRIHEAISLAGGLKPEATDYAYIFRTSPFSPRKTEYIQASLRADSNMQLRSGDRLIVLNKENFVREFTLNVLGDVAIPGTFRFDSSLGIADLIRLSGGYNLSADPTFVDVFRVEFPVGKPTRRFTITLPLDTSGNPLDKNFRLRPFDAVVIRKTPRFYLTETVDLRGEVEREGSFSLENHRIHFSEIVRKAGGATKYSDLSNASLIRTNTNYKGSIFFNGAKAMKKARKIKYDPILRSGDQIFIPRVSNLVILRTANTNYSKTEIADSLIITFQGRKNAATYIRRFGGGIMDVDSMRYSYKVIHANGFQESTRRYWLFKIHPKVERGDIVSVMAIPNPPKNKESKSKVDWDKRFTQLMSLTTTLVLLRAYINP